MNIRVRLTFSIGTNGFIHQANVNLKDISIFHIFFLVSRSFHFRLVGISTCSTDYILCV